MAALEGSQRKDVNWPPGPAIIYNVTCQGGNDH